MIARIKFVDRTTGKTHTKKKIKIKTKIKKVVEYILHGAATDKNTRHRRMYYIK